MNKPLVGKRILVPPARPDAPYAEQKKVSRLWMRRNGPDEIVATEILPGDIAHIHTDIPG